MYAWIWISLILGTNPQGAVPVLSPPGDCPELRAPSLPSSLNQPAAAAAAQTMHVPPSPTLQFQLVAGRLKPQLERLLAEAFAIQHVVWRAPEGLQWTSSYHLSGQDWHSMVEAILRPYQLQLSIYANHTAVVAPRAAGVAL